MLKIKDNIDLEELAEKYGFIYCKDWSDPYQDDNYGYLVYEDNLRICWRNDYDYKEGKITIRNCTSKALDKLYDLHEAGLVEKVEG